MDATLACAVNFYYVAGRPIFATHVDDWASHEKKLEGFGEMPYFFNVIIIATRCRFTKPPEMLNHINSQFGFLFSILSLKKLVSASAGKCMV